MSKKRKKVLDMNELLNKIRGVQTIESIKNALDIDKTKAIYIVYKLRKKGYVITKQDSGNNRIYFISRENALGGTSYIDVLNKYSPIKLSTAEVYKIYGREVSIEETIIYSLKTRKFRYILASLALYKKIKDWRELYRLAKRNNLVREVGSLYSLIEHILPRVKKIHKIFLYYALPKDNNEYKFIIPNLRSEDYRMIEEKWRVHIPFNKEDLKEYLK
jgi:DNA-binding Lrp family transcriptional regulator